MLKIKLNDDTNLVKEVTQQLKENDGYCPCKIVKNNDTKCMCTEFKSQNSPGECHCGLYIKYEDNCIEKQLQHNNVIHPTHYNNGKLEVWDFIKEQELDFFLGNAIKYITRAGKKSKETTIEDLQKAINYLNKEIEILTFK